MIDLGLVYFPRKNLTSGHDPQAALAVARMFLARQRCA